jgi:hypothetical protein
LAILLTDVLLAGHQEQPVRSKGMINGRASIYWAIEFSSLSMREKKAEPLTGLCLFSVTVQTPISRKT